MKSLAQIDRRVLSIRKKFIFGAFVLGSLVSITGSAAELAAGDRQFLINAAEAGHAEILASKNAQTKAALPEVKFFASMMLSDDTIIADELRQLASGKSVQLPSGPSIEQKEKVVHLFALEGKQFDREYAQEIGISARKDTVALFRKAAHDAKDRDVKMFASRMLPVLIHHLEIAENLNKKITSGDTNRALMFKRSLVLASNGLQAATPTSAL